MKKLIAFLAFILSTAIGIVYGQKVKETGDLSKLKGVKAITIEFNYDNMGVGKYADEQEYLKDGVAKRNEKKAGAGDEWRAKWVADRKEDFQPKFEQLFKENFSAKGVSAKQNNPEAQVTMLIHTVFTEPGFNVGVVRKSAFIDVVVKFIDKASGNEFAQLKIDNVPGRDAMGYDFDTSYRIQESYAKLGKTVGKYLSKEVYK